MRRSIVPALAALVWCVGLAPAADKAADRVEKAAPKSTAARDAVAKADRSRKQADTIWARAVADAKRQEIADLKDAQKAALARNDLDEATAIAELTKEVQAELDALTGRGALVTVAAKAGWQPGPKLPKGT